MHEAVAAIAACGSSPIVRIADNQGWMIKRALDAGAHGLIVPLLNTEEDAKRVVASAKFPPLGIRGFGSPFAMEKFNVQSMTDYLQQANESLVTIVQIETKEALQNVDAIAKVSGVDVLLVGPFDLGNSLGYPILEGKMAKELKEAIASILRAAIDNGKRAAIYATSGDQAREYADQGFHMVSDVVELDENADKILDISSHRCDNSSNIFGNGFGNGKRFLHSFSSECCKRCGFWCFETG
jgi:4-hydroxy-2-oxoheptanedioate aldolase